MRLLRHLGLTCLLLAAAGALAASPPELQQRLDRVFAASCLQGADLAVVVRSEAGATLYDRRSNLPLMPASNMKLVTAATALRTWGEDYRFPTALYADAAPDAAGVVKGNLYLKGLAHPTLDRAFVVRLAQRLKAEGLRQVTGAVVCAGPLTCEPHPHPEQRDATALHGALTKLGVTIAQPPGPGEVPASAVLVHRWESDSTGMLLTSMNKRSDNDIADGFMQTLRFAHGASRSTYDQFVQGVWKPLGLPLEGCRFVDGSGLSRQNRLTAAFLVSLLRAAREDDLTGPAFIRSLPVAGQDGTLRLRMTKTCAAGKVHAKTGFLTGACTLSGYVDGNQQNLCFSILINNHRCGPEPMREIQNRACVAMAEWLAAAPPP